MSVYISGSEGGEQQSGPPTAPLEEQTTPAAAAPPSCLAISLATSITLLHPPQGGAGDTAQLISREARGMHALEKSTVQCPPDG